MAAKVLLGVVALAAVVGSPFAYNYFKSSSVETQEEEEKATDKQPVTAEKPANSVPEVAADRPEIKVQATNQEEAAKEPKDDRCNIGPITNWDSLGSPVSDQNLCVKGVVESQRQN